VNFLVGLNSDNWPTAIPLDRVSSIRVDPDDMEATLEFLDDTRSETLAKAVLCNEAETMWMLRSLATIAKDDAEKARGA
jgi:hypothetical protein